MSLKLKKIVQLIVPSPLAAVMEMLFNEGFSAIHTDADERKDRSNAVIRKKGFEFVGTEIRPCSGLKAEIVTLNVYKKDRRF